MPRNHLDTSGLVFVTKKIHSTFDTDITKNMSMQACLVANNVPICLAELVDIKVSTHSNVFNAVNVRAVLTKQEFRCQGYGQVFMKALTAHIKTRAIDMGILFCTDALLPFYAACGWQAADQGTTRIGSAERHQVYELRRMVLLVSERAGHASDLLQKQIVYLDAAG